MGKHSLQLVSLIFLFGWQQLLAVVDAFGTVLLQKQFIRPQGNRHKRVLYSQAIDDPLTTNAGCIVTVNATESTEESATMTIEASDEVLSPLAALDHFLSVCSELNQKHEDSIQIIPRGTSSSKLPAHYAIETRIYSTDKSCIIAIVADGCRVDPSELGTVLSSLSHLEDGSVVNQVPDDQITSICGLLPGTIPPLGHISNKKSILILVDQGLFEQCQDERKMMLGGGGNAYWQSLVSPDLLTSLSNVYVAPISSLSTGDKDGDDDTTCAASSFLSASSTVDSMNTPKDFSQFEPPPINIAKMVIQQRQLSNPLVPSLITLRGQVGKIESKGKRYSTFEFLPLQMDDNEEGGQKNQRERHWKATNGVALSLNLIAGKPLLQLLGAKQGEAAIRTLKEGLEIQVQAKTNVGNRESLVKWIETSTLDLLVTDFQFLTHGMVDGSTASVIDNSNKPYKHKPKEVTATPLLPTLQLKDVFEDGGEVLMVDSLDTIQEFMQDYTEILSLPHSSIPEPLEKSTSIAPKTTMVGIDCEWQPRQFLQMGEPQPILLMQISLEQLQKVYIFDFQSLLRPLLPQEETMNAMETMVSDILSDVFTSTRVIKTGYQLPSDLRRVAASYPHMPCFKVINSVVEVSTLIKRILHITKQKKSRSITMSLARMTSHYLGKTVDKEHQASDWAKRPLSSQQLDYAALDAAISPQLTAKALESVDARIVIQNNVIGDPPRIQRWDGDEGLKKEIESWQFEIFTEDPAEINKFQAKQIVGTNWVVAENWITGELLRPDEHLNHTQPK